MESSASNIHPIFDSILSREPKEKLLNQKAKVIWLTGLSGSGKSTIATNLEQKLYKEGFYTALLDGDNIRTGINNNLGFSEIDRTENIRRIAEVCKLFLNNGTIVISSFVSPTNEIRNIAKNIIGQEDFLEIYVNTSLEECEKRDVKGLYQKAKKGEIKDFTGISAPFDAPENPSLEIKTEELSIEDAVQKLYNFILTKITYIE